MPDALERPTPTELTPLQAMWALGSINNTLVPQGGYPLTKAQAEHIDATLKALTPDQHGRTIIGLIERLVDVAFPEPVNGPDPRD